MLPLRILLTLLAQKVVDNGMNTERDIRGHTFLLDPELDRVARVGSEA